MAYIGNDDFRGYLAARASSPGGLDPNAQRALDIDVGNDGGYDPNRLNSYYDSPTGDRTSERDAQVNWTTNEYNNWSAGRTPQVQSWNDTNSSTSGSGSDTAPAVDDTAEERAYLDQQEGLLRQLFGRADTTLNQGLSNLTDTYNRTKGDADTDQSRRTRDFGIKQQDTERGKDQAINRVNDNARTLSNSVRRRLGLAAGNSSALGVADNAVAREASGDRTNVLESFGQNFRGIDLARKDTEDDFTRFMRDLDIQKGSKEQQLRTGVEQEKQSVNERLAEIARQRSSLQGGGFSQQTAAQQPYLNAVNEGNSRIDGLFEQFRTPQLSVAPVQDRQVSLRDYIVNRKNISGGQNQAQQQLAPYIRPKDEEELRVL